MQERESAKHLAITRAVAEALQERGVDRRQADLAARAGLAVLSYALPGWFADSSLQLDHYLDRAFLELQKLSSPIGI